jgi:hypothetical protein
MRLNFQRTEVVCDKQLTNTVLRISRICERLAWIVLKSSSMPQDQKDVGKSTLPALPALPALGALGALGALVAIGLAVAPIVEGNAQNGNAQEQYALGQNGLPHPVPDGGSTAALLGLSAALVVLERRKFAIAK